MNSMTMGEKTKKNEEQRKGERADAELQHRVVSRRSRQLVDRGEGAPGVGGGGLGPWGLAVEPLGRYVRERSSGREERMADSKYVKFDVLGRSPCLAIVVT